MGGAMALDIKAGIGEPAQFGPIHQRVAQQGDGVDFKRADPRWTCPLVEQRPDQRPVPFEPKRRPADEVDG